jgi:hypothetical protein
MAGNIAKRANGKWRARYRDEAGNERARHFDRKVDAQRWLDEISSTVMSGTYVDPTAGKITFKRSTKSGHRDSCGCPRPGPTPTSPPDRSPSPTYP